MGKSSAVTRGVQVEVEARYLSEQSEPISQRWLFGYQVTISNVGEEVVQLVSREWVITNADGVVETVRGAGVVGHQPTLRPGEGFRYVSACPLNTPIGTMHGTYQMVTDAGENFDAVIAPFVLADPLAVN